MVNTGHDIDWSVDILDKDLNQRRRLVREAVMIRRNKPSMNGEQGFELSRAYNNIIQRESSNTRTLGGGNHPVAPPTL